LFVEDKQIDSAKEAAYQAIAISSGRLDDCQDSEHHHILGHLHESSGETEVAIGHFVTGLEAAPSIILLRCLLHILLEGDWFDAAQIYLDSLRLFEANDPYRLDMLLVSQAYIHYGQGRLGRAKSELSHMINTCERAGTLGDLLDDAKVFLQVLEVGTNNYRRYHILHNQSLFRWTLPI